MFNDVILVIQNVPLYAECYLCQPRKEICQWGDTPKMSSCVMICWCLTHNCRSKEYHNMFSIGAIANTIEQARMGRRLTKEERLVLSRASSQNSLVQPGSAMRKYCSWCKDVSEESRAVSLRFGYEDKLVLFPFVNYLQNGSLKVMDCIMVCLPLFLLRYSKPVPKSEVSTWQLILLPAPHSKSTVFSPLIIFQ